MPLFDYDQSLPGTIHCYVTYHDYVVAYACSVPDRPDLTIVAVVTAYPLYRRYGLIQFVLSQLLTAFKVFEKTISFALPWHLPMSPAALNWIDDNNLELRQDYGRRLPDFNLDTQQCYIFRVGVLEILFPSSPVSPGAHLLSNAINVRCSEYRFLHYHCVAV